jgi:hypothetical protein
MPTAIHYHEDTTVNSDEARTFVLKIDEGATGGDENLDFEATFHLASSNDEWLPATRTEGNLAFF